MLPLPTVTHPSWSIYYLKYKVRSVEVEVHPNCINTHQYPSVLQHNFLPWVILPIGSFEHVLWQIPTRGAAPLRKKWGKSWVLHRFERNHLQMDPWQKRITFSCGFLDQTLGCLENDNFVIKWNFSKEGHWTRWDRATKISEFNQSFKILLQLKRSA